MGPGPWAPSGSGQRLPPTHIQGAQAFPRRDAPRKSCQRDVSPTAGRRRGVSHKWEVPTCPLSRARPCGPCFHWSWGPAPCKTARLTLGTEGLVGEAGQTRMAWSLQPDGSFPGGKGGVPNLCRRPQWKSGGRTSTSEPGGAPEGFEQEEMTLSDLL